MMWLDNARVLAAFAVVVLHVSASVLGSAEPGSGYWWFGNAYDSAVRWSVPVFVMISGALLLAPHRKESLVDFYKKRLSRLLIPILFWSAFYLVWTMLRGHMKGDVPSGAELARRLLAGKPYVHMWYMYMIIGLYLFTPFLRTIIEYSTERALLLLAGFMLAIAAMNSIYRAIYPSANPILFMNLFLEYVPYFVIGHIVRHSTSNPSKRLLLSILGFSIVATMFGFYCVSMKSSLGGDRYFMDFLSVTVIIMSISIMFLLKTLDFPILSGNVTKQIAALTLGVYLIHPMLLEILTYKGLGARGYDPLVSVPVVAVLVFFISLLGAWCIYHIPFVKRII